MILYHGSKQKVEVLKPHQAEAGEGVAAPEGDLLKAIYLTPNKEFAIAIASIPEGQTNIDNETKTIRFENPELYDPESEIYIYKVDISKIPKEHVRQVDERQYAVIDLPEVKPDSVVEMKAGEVEKYYEIKKLNKEGDMEMTGEGPRPESRK
ncbi:hypothetical protein ACFL04_04090 [Patescibacteria group bacterium]